MPFQPAVLGIDASARSTGVVIIDSSGTSIEHVIKTRNLKEGARLSYIADELEAVISGITIHLAVMEGPSYKSTNKPFTLGEVYGVCKLTAFKKGIPLVVVAPRALKKYATGTGTAKKELMIKKALEDGCQSNQEDIADAWHLAKLAKDILASKASSGRRASEEVVQETRKKYGPYLKLPSLGRQYVPSEKG